VFYFGFYFLLFVEYCPAQMVLLHYTSYKCFCDNDDDDDDDGDTLGGAFMLYLISTPCIVTAIPNCCQSVTLNMINSK